MKTIRSLIVTTILCASIGVITAALVDVTTRQVFAEK